MPGYVVCQPCIVCPHQWGSHYSLSKVNSNVSEIEYEGTSHFLVTGRGSKTPVFG